MTPELRSTLHDATAIVCDRVPFRSLWYFAVSSGIQEHTVEMALIFRATPGQESTTQGVRAPELSEVLVWFRDLLDTSHCMGQHPETKKSQPLLSD